MTYVWLRCCEESSIPFFMAFIISNFLSGNFYFSPSSPSSSSFNFCTKDVYIAVLMAITITHKTCTDRFMIIIIYYFTTFKVDVIICRYAMSLFEWWLTDTITFVTWASIFRFRHGNNEKWIKLRRHLFDER